MGARFYCIYERGHREYAFSANESWFLDLGGGGGVGGEGGRLSEKWRMFGSYGWKFFGIRRCATRYVGLWEMEGDFYARGFSDYRYAVSR